MDSVAVMTKILAKDIGVFGVQGFIHVQTTPRRVPSSPQVNLYRRFQVEEVSHDV